MVLATSSWHHWTSWTPITPLRRAGAWGTRKQRWLLLPSTRKDGAAGITTPSSSHHCRTISQSKPPDPAKTYKISRCHLFLPRSPEFLDGEREGKHFVVKKKVKEGACGGARFCWLEWDCPEESRFVTGIEIVPQRWRAAQMWPAWRSTLRWKVLLLAVCDSPDFRKQPAWGNGGHCVARYACRRSEIFTEFAKTWFLNLASCLAPPIVWCV